MSAATVFGLCAAVAVGLGLYGLIAHPQPLRKILAFNLLGSGAFLLFGVVARRGAVAGFVGDPVPQALVITGIVVAFAASALAVALLLRLFQATGDAALASGASGQRGNSIVRRPDTCPEPGSACVGVPSSLIELKNVARCHCRSATRLTTCSLAASSATTLTTRGLELG
jgi:multicomponent Na+:H+ antiporter subunit C